MLSTSKSTQAKPSGSSRPNKRPLSPEGPNLFSPAKRRILTQEGIFSPDKTMKSSLRGRSSPGGSFADLLQTGSPAKRLDYGRPPKSSSSELPTLSNPVRSQAPSPEVFSKMASNSTPRRNIVDDDFFATPERLQPSFTLIPRELPPASDPQSIHHPGFTIHRDAHILVMNSEGLQITLEEDKDEWKENIPQRRKIKKAITEPLPAKVLTPKQELEKLFKAKSTPATPRKVASKEWQEPTSPTPRRTGLRSRVGTPVTEEEKRQRRQMLRDELEEAGGIDEDEEEDL